jgi:hypothetical protein
MNEFRGHAVAGAADKLIAQCPHNSAMFGAHTIHTDSHCQEILLKRCMLIVLYSSIPSIDREMFVSRHPTPSAQTSTRACITTSARRGIKTTNHPKKTITFRQSAMNSGLLVKSERY